MEWSEAVNINTILLLIITILLAVAGFFGAKLYSRIVGSVDTLSEKVEKIDKLVYGIRIHLGLENGNDSNREDH